MKYLILAAIVIVFAAYLMRGRIRNSVTLSQEHKDLLRRAIDPALVARIIFHLSVGNKLAAINELRNAHGLQQAAAEFLVDQIRKGHRPPGSANAGTGAGTGPVVPGEATVTNEERLT